MILKFNKKTLNTNNNKKKLNGKFKDNKNNYILLKLHKIVQSKQRFGKQLQMGFKFLRQLVQRQ